HLSQLVVHLQQCIDDAFDLLRHPIELVVRDAGELATDLLVERHDAAEAADLDEPTVDLLVRSQDPFELTPHVRLPDLDVLPAWSRGTWHICTRGATGALECTSGAVRHAAIPRRQRRKSAGTLSRPRGSVWRHALVLEPCGFP